MKLYKVVVVPDGVKLLPYVQKKIFDSFSTDNCLFSVTQVARRTGRSRKRVRTVIKKMEQAGYVECVVECAM